MNYIIYLANAKTPMLLLLRTRKGPRVHDYHLGGGCRQNRSSIIIFSFIKAEIRFLDANVAVALVELYSQETCAARRGNRIIFSAT